MPLCVVLFHFLLITFFNKIVKGKDEHAMDFQKYCIFVSMTTLFGCIILTFQRYFTDEISWV